MLEPWLEGDDHGIDPATEEELDRDSETPSDPERGVTGEMASVFGAVVAVIVDGGYYVGAKVYSLAGLVPACLTAIVIFWLLFNQKQEEFLIAEIGLSKEAALFVTAVSFLYAELFFLGSRPRKPWLIRVKAFSWWLFPVLFLAGIWDLAGLEPFGSITFIALAFICFWQFKVIGKFL